MNQLNTITRETVTFPGPRGVLTGELAYAEEDLGVVLVIGPHPYMGGTMENNVVVALVESLASLGYVSLRFNYTALSNETVAKSMLDFWTTGHTPQDPELIEEARSAERWLVDQFHTPPHLVGYSFGAEVASETLMSNTPSIVLIAPTVKVHDLSTVSASTVPKLVIYSTDDFATTQLATESWYDDVAEPKSKRCLVRANHFFKGFEKELIEQVRSHIQLNPCLSTAEIA